MKEHQIRYKASALGLRISLDGEFHRDRVSRTAKALTGRKRPAHSKLMKQYAKEYRVLKSRHVITKTKNCTECGVTFFPSERGHSNFRCCSENCANKRTRRKWEPGTHPRGMLGKKHTEDTKKKISIGYKKAWSNPNSKLNSQENRQRISDSNSQRHANGTFYKEVTNPYSRCRSSWWKSGKRKYYMRSSWEINYAWYLEWLRKKGDIKKWEYEVDTFWFEAIKRGVRSYKPDFKVYLLDGSIEYHEVKGWMDAKSKTKIQRMAKYYPDIKLIVIDSDSYKNIKQWSRLIPNWI